VPPEYFSLVADHGLKIAAIAGHGSLMVGLNKRDQHARIKKEIEAKIVDAVRYGIPNLICFSGNRDGLADDKGGEITAEGLALLVPLAEREGITLILELLNSSRSSRFIRRITPLAVFAQTYGVDGGNWMA
jgi:hydroxypyruvate isomerase